VNRSIVLNGFFGQALACTKSLILKGLTVRADVVIFCSNSQTVLNWIKVTEPDIHLELLLALATVLKGVELDV
jgi:hypothetical protein